MVFEDQMDLLREVKSSYSHKITGLELSGKMQVVAKLLDHFHESGKNDKVLLFSYSTRVREKFEFVEFFNCLCKLLSNTCLKRSKR